MSVEYFSIESYFIVAAFIGFLASIVVAFISRRDGKSTSESILISGVAGAIAGMCWPGVIFIGSAGCIGVCACCAWESILRILNK